MGPSKFELLDTLGHRTVTENLQSMPKMIVEDHPYPVEMLDGNLETLPNGTRMIVVVDHETITDADFARIIWSIASQANINVLYLSLAYSEEDQFSTERRLASLAAITRDTGMKAEIQVIRGKDWSKAIQQEWKPGDIVVCHSEQMVPRSIFNHEPLSARLISNQTTPIYIFSGIYHQPRSLLKHRLLLIPYWLSLVAIIAGFFEMEALVYQSVKGAAGIFIVSLLFLVELALVWIWNIIQV